MDIHFGRKNRLAAGAPDADEDGVPDDCGDGSFFRRGDTNADGKVDIADVVVSVSVLFPGFVLIPSARDPSPFSDAVDANDDGVRNVSDVLYLANYLFSGGQPPPAPFAECGQDPTADELSCDSLPSC